MEEKETFTSTTNGIVKHQKSRNRLKDSEIEIPNVLFESVNRILQENLIHSGTMLPNQESIEDFWKILIKPEFQEGINKGELLIKKGSLEIRNAKNGQFVGKANLNKLNLEDVAKKDTLSSLSNITKSITSISGQLQMAEISMKLDLIHDKLNLIGDFLWREKVADLQAINSTIEEAIESLPNKYAVRRINDSIKDLKGLSIFFEETIETLLSNTIDYRLSKDFIDGLKFWEWRSISRNEYNKKYTSEIQAFINEYNFLLDLYFQALGLIGTCYQITNEYHNASKYFHSIESKINVFSSELTSKLIYLLNINDSDIENEVVFSQIPLKLENRNLPDSMLNEIKQSDQKIKTIKDMHKKLTTQFENIEIEYEINSSLLLEGLNNE